VIQENLMGAKLKAYLRTFYSKLTTDVSDLWQKDKVFLAVFFAIIVALKFNSALINIISISARRLFNSTTAATDALQKEENSVNEQANKLVEDANKLSPSDEQVDDDWNQK
jgi:hypothetical protein